MSSALFLIPVLVTSSNRLAFGAEIILGAFSRKDSTRIYLVANDAGGRRLGASVIGNFSFDENRFADLAAHADETNLS